MRYPTLFSLTILAALTAVPLHAAEYVVAPCTVDDRKAVFGTVESVHQTQARARIAGTLAEMIVVEGDRVVAGQVIARVRDPKLALQLAETDARVKTLAARQAQAKIDFDRMARLQATHAVSQAQYDEAHTALAVFTSQISAMQAARELIIEQQAEGAVRAPAAGRILKVNKIAGSVVMPGEVVAALAEQTYVLRIFLPERHAQFIKVGEAVDVGAPDSDPMETRQGRIALVYPELDHGRIVADVEVGGLGDFFVGERTPVYVATGRRETYLVPANFVFRRFGVYFVRLKGLGDVAVQTGESRPQGIEVLSGIQTGDVLVAP